MTLIDYDVSNVTPIRDPAPGKRRRRRRKRRAALLPEHERYRLYRVDELSEFPLVEWLVDRYLARRELSVLWGSGGTFKSFLALDWAATLASGGQPVVYIAAEGASGMRARVAAWMRHYGVAELPQLYVMPANVNVHRALEVATWTAAMRAQLRGATPVLVVVDTLARNFVGGSENDPREMGEFVDGLERIRKEFDTAVLVIHHATKEGKTERGTESLRNASFAMFEVVDRGGSGRAADVRCDRMKDAEPPPTVRINPVQVSLPEELGEGASSLVAGWPGSGCEQGGRSDGKRPELRPELSGRQAKLLKALHGRSDGRSPEDLASYLKISQRTLRKELKTLRESGLAAVEGRTSDRRYVLTEDGREVA